MKKPYTIPETCYTEMLAAELLASSPGGSGQNYGDPLIITDDEFNDIF